MKSSTEWISISDMMTGLMMIFLFISVIYLEQSLKNVDSIKEGLEEYKRNKDLIYKSLYKEFHKDLKKWNADLIKDSLIVRFLSPQIMFNPGEITIKPEFKKILSDFCPRYLSLLYRLDLKNQAKQLSQKPENSNKHSIHESKAIDEIRIEGHTSSEWIGLPPSEAYFKNMELSQGRTRSVLQYCVRIEKPNSEIRKWAVKHLTANGLSSSRPICCEDTIRCRTKNRRVDFRIQIKSIMDFESTSQKLCPPSFQKKPVP